jgi:hypothetical protein|tara:strand:+ start:824 stop:1111 length:288 start_codon:yes stop_codon:yes gene_type:complete
MTDDIRNYLRNYNPEKAILPDETQEYMHNRTIEFMKKTAYVLIATAIVAAVGYRLGCAIDGPSDHVRDKQAQKLLAIQDEAKLEKQRDLEARTAD